LCGPTQTAIAAYGAPEGIEDFCRKAQMVNMEVYKAIYEAWNDRMWNDCTGVMIWMSNPAWPSLTWNTYDYYMEPTAAYFACRKACEPIHIQWNIVTNHIKVVNSTLNELRGLNAEAVLYNLDGSLVQTKTAQLNCPANSVQDCLQLFVPGETEVDRLSNVHFIKLALKDNAGKLLSSNFYWRSKAEWKYEELKGMAEVQINGTVDELKAGNVAVNLENRTSSMALMVRLKLVDISTGLLLAPVSYSDNYFSMAPHETRQVDIRLNGSQVNHAIALRVEGWNITPSELSRFKY
jgi:hypothetical protein